MSEQPYSINNPDLQVFLRSTYDQSSLSALWDFLSEKETLTFTPLDTHLYPAAAAEDAKNTGYQYVWVRDNVYVAYAHYLMGADQQAAATLNALMRYAKKFRHRFEVIIEQPKRRHQVMQRPHIRFDGKRLEELDEDWEHAQNDALGYFLWLYCKLALADETASLIKLDPQSYDMLVVFARYFEAIDYWADLDSGHWEEGRKVAASSIGAVVAGLQQLQQLYRQRPMHSTAWLESRSDVGGDRPSWDGSALITRLIEAGQQAIDSILPWESREPADCARRDDSALLFLIYPLEVVSDEQADAILAGVGDRLTGYYGIQRYPFDSFWCRDFQDLDQSIQTAKYTHRQAWLQAHGRSVQRGEEAQWCIFDSIVSAIYGQRFQQRQHSADLERQTLHFNRALGQITGFDQRVVSKQGDAEVAVDISAYRCPELYFIQASRYTPNGSTPLLWAQANLCIALTMMQKSMAST